MVKEEKSVRINSVCLEVAGDLVEIVANDDGKCTFCSQQDNSVYLDAKGLKEIAATMEKLDSGVI